MKALDSQEPPSTLSETARRAILFEGCANKVGNVGRLVDRATYTLYSPDTDTVRFRKVFYSTRKKFQPQPSIVAAIAKIHHPLLFSREDDRQTAQLVDIDYQLA